MILYSALSITGAAACGYLGYMHLQAYRQARSQMEALLLPQRRPDGPLLRRAEAWFAETTVGAACTEYVEKTGLAMSALRYATLLAALAGGLYLAGTRALEIGWQGGLSLVLVGVPVLTSIHLRYTRQKFLQALQDQVPELALMFSNALRAGYGITQALAYLAQGARMPARRLFVDCHDAVQLGQPPDDALQGLAERFDSPDLRLFIVTVLVQKQAGGNLVTALENVARTASHRRETLGEVRAALAQARQSVNVLPFMPLLCGLLFNLLMPGFLTPLFTGPGLIVLTIVVTLQVVLALLIRRVARIEV